MCEHAWPGQLLTGGGKLRDNSAGSSSGVVCECNAATRSSKEGTSHCRSYHMKWIAQTEPRTPSLWRVMVLGGKLALYVLQHKCAMSGVFTRVRICERSVRRGPSMHLRSVKSRQHLQPDGGSAIRAFSKVNSIADSSRPCPGQAYREPLSKRFSYVDAAVGLGPPPPLLGRWAVNMVRK